jgi:DNA-directed RNA polymerase specialized sigma24 family protein
VKGSLGIDLAARGNEVRKLFYAGNFTGTLMKQGIDPEDFLQEVYRGLLARDNGTCPWDATKSSFGHYVHIVIKCVLSNYLRKDRRRTLHEDLTTDGMVVEGEVSGSEGSDDFGRREILRELFPQGWERIESLVGGLELGKTRKEMALELGMSASEVDSSLARIRTSLTK